MGGIGNGRNWQRGALRWSAGKLMVDQTGLFRRGFSRSVQEIGLGADIFMHDRDSKFTTSFDAVLKEAKLRVQKSHNSPSLPPRPETACAA